MNDRLLLVVNPCAGRRRASRFLPEIEKTLCECGFDVVTHKTKASGEATSVVRNSAGEFARVVVVGGDGSLNEVIAGVIQSNARTPIGYIPAGTTNDLARSLKLSTEILRAAKVAGGHAIAPLDIGVFNGRYFVYTASFGAFTRASYAAPQQYKNALGHLAYMLEGVKDIGRIHPIHLEIEANGQHFSEEYIFGAVSNSTSMGGVLKLDPRRVDLRDGKFELLLIKAPEFMPQLLNTIAALQWRNYEYEGMRFLTADHIRIKADPEMPWTLDGEYENGAAEIDIRVLAGAVDFVVVPDQLEQEE